jgi:hypothetical protein
MWEQNVRFPAANDRRLIGSLWPSGGVIGMASSVVASSMQLNIAAGQAVVPDPNTFGGAYLCVSDAVEVVTIGNPGPVGQNRIDVVTVQPRDTALGGPSDDWLFNVVVGATASSPTAPAVPAGQLAICQIYVPGASGTPSLVAGNLTDRRPRGLAVPPQGDVSAVPSGRLYATGDTSCNTGAETPVALAGTNFLYGGMTRQTLSGRDSLIMPLAGVYLVTCQVGWRSLTASQQIFTELWRNGAEARRWFAAVNWAALPMCGGSDALSLNAGDQLAVIAFQSSSVAVNTFGDSNHTYLSATLVSTGP